MLSQSPQRVAQKLRQKPVSAKVAETLVETCFCQDGLNRFGAGRNLPTLYDIRVLWHLHSLH